MPPPSLIGIQPGDSYKCLNNVALAANLNGTAVALPHSDGADIRGTDIRWKVKYTNSTVTNVAVKLQGSLGDKAIDDPANWDWYDLDSSNNIAGDSRMIHGEKSRFVRPRVSSFTTPDNITVEIFI